AAPAVSNHAARSGNLAQGHYDAEMRAPIVPAALILIRFLVRPSLEIEPASRLDVRSVDLLYGLALMRPVDTAIGNCELVGRAGLGELGDDEPADHGRRRAEHRSAGQNGSEGSQSHWSGGA